MNLNSGGEDDVLDIWRHVVDVAVVGVTEAPGLLLPALPYDVAALGVRVVVEGVGKGAGAAAVNRSLRRSTDAGKA